MPELGELYEQTKEKVDQLTEEVKRLSGPEREEALRKLKLVKTERRSIWDDIGNAIKQACPWNLFKRCGSNSDCGCKYLRCIRRNFFFFTTSSCGYI
ncbi:hypothetical protein MAR_003282 [Mya arenaria]|nr:hypothetical protein MAR_003282 [Mya arenaria]